MRISPAAYIPASEADVRACARVITGTTHDHPEGIKGAEAVTVAIWMARHSCSKFEIKERIERDYYKLDFNIDEIRDKYEFDETCQGTVPVAIEAFVESSSFENAIRTAISVGGDSDTIADITGGIAEAYYGVPNALRYIALSYLTSDLRAIYDEWAEYVRR
jgi:ADP-ribosylglycohydrolase